MATITRFPMVSHYRGEPNTEAVRFRDGDVRPAGVGGAFWFRALTAAIAEVPVDDRDVDVMVRGRSADFQDVAVAGVVTYRIADRTLAARRLDFSIDVRTGRWRGTPLEQLAGLVTQIVQQHLAGYLQATPLATLLAEGVDVARARVAAGLARDALLRDLGVEVVAVRVAAVRPAADVEKALQTPARERIQQAADEATFARRALAVEKERAIAQNELATRVELARKTEDLVTQEGANERLRAREAADAERIRTEGEAERVAIAARARADATRIEAAATAEEVREVEGERVRQERERVAVYAEQGPQAVLALALREALANLPEIGQINLTPDLVTGALARLMTPGAGEV